MRGDTPLWSGLIGSFATQSGRSFSTTMGLHTLSSSVSDHCPLLLSNNARPRRPRSFKFENFWTVLPGFKQVVEHAWSKPTQHHEPFHRLYYKLQSTARALRGWSSRLVPDSKLFMHMAMEVLLRLDLAQCRTTSHVSEAHWRCVSLAMLLLKGHVKGIIPIC